MKIKTLLITPYEEDLWKLCERLEYEVFEQEGYIAPNINRRISQFDDYKHSRFVAVVKKKSNDADPLELNDFTGVMRFVHIPDETKMRKGLFPTIDSAEELKVPAETQDMLMSIDPRACMDLTSTAIPLKYRATETLWAFMEFFSKHLPTVQYLLATLDNRVYRMSKYYFIKIKELGPPVYYWGSLTTAVLLDRYDLS